jgi:hypothetical protein
MTHTNTHTHAVGFALLVACIAYLSGKRSSSCAECDGSLVLARSQNKLDHLFPGFARNQAMHFPLLFRLAWHRHLPAWRDVRA